MTGKGRIVYGERWGRRLLGLLESSPHGVTPWMHRHTRIVKDDTHVLVGMCALHEQPCVLKLYRRRSRISELLDRLRVGRPLRSFRTARRLAERGVPVPRPLSCVRVDEGLLVLQQGLPPGRDYAGLWAAGGPALVEAIEMLAGAGSTLAGLHRLGYVHGDCKWDNLLWHERRCVLIDLDGAGHRRRGRARDLARFTLSAEQAGVTAQQYAVFLDHYVRESGAKRERLLAAMRPPLTRLRERHRAQYGRSSAPLV